MIPNQWTVIKIIQNKVKAVKNRMKMMDSQPKFKRGIGKLSKSAVLVTFRPMFMYMFRKKLPKMKPFWKKPAKMGPLRVGFN